MDPSPHEQDIIRAVEEDHRVLLALLTNLHQAIGGRNVPPEEVCARTIKGLRSRGVEKIYVCNLGERRPADVLRSIEERL